MTILGGLIPPTAQGRARFAYDAGNSAGPASYVAGGFTLTSLLTAPTDWQAWTDDETLLRATATVSRLVMSISGGTITVKVYDFITLANSAAIAWAETANTGNFAGKTFRYRAVGA